MNRIKQLNEIEAKYNLNDVETDGFHPWTYTRVSIAVDIISFDNAHTAENNRASLWSRALKFFLTSIKCLCLLLRNNYKPLGDVDILFLCTGRRTLNDGLYENVYTDDIAELFPNSITLEQDYELTHFSPAKTKNLFFYSRYSVICFFVYAISKYLFKGRYNKKYKELHGIFEKPLNELSGNNDVLVTKWISDMAKYYFMYGFMRKKLSNYLAKVYPKIIIEEEHYSFCHMIINEIAKERGVPVIELQHSRIGENHSAYNYPIGVKIRQFPDMIFLFSEYWKNNAAYPIAQNMIIPTGFPYFEKQVNVLSDNVKALDKKNIVFLGYIFQGFDKLAVDVHNRLKHSGWKVIVKLHPFEYNNWRIKNKVLADSGVEVIDTNQRNLYEIFASSTVLVGIDSTSVYEGIGFGLHAFIYDCPESKKLEDLCDNGLAKRVKDCDSLCTEIENLSDKNEKSAFLWKSNALENIKNEIENMLAKV